MRVSLLVGSTLYPLAGEDGVSERVHSSAADFSVDPQAESQYISRVRASTGAVVDRGNLLTRISFTTTRKFPTVPHASMWLLDYDRTTPREGIVVLEDTSPLGAVLRRHLLGAVVSPPRRRHTGCTVFLDYSIQGSEIIFVEGEPGTIPSGILLDEDGDPILDESGFYIYLES
jgi:hypothetical protein